MSILFGIAESGLGSAAVFVRRRRSDGAYWYSVTPAYEAYNTAHIASYATAATETGVGTGQYTASDPDSSATEGDYLLVVKSGTGGTVLTQADLAAARWQDRTPSVNVNVTSVGGTAQTAGDIVALLNAQGPGTGARTVTITVNDGTTVLQNARVRMYLNGSNQWVLTTNSSGVCTFNLDDGSYMVSITLDGYTFSGATLTVSGATTHTYSMTAASITPSAPGMTTGYLTCYTNAGVVQSGVTVTATLTSVGAIMGVAAESEERSATSDVNGLVQFTNLILGMTYVFRRGTDSIPFEKRIPTTAGTTYVLPSIYGSP